MHYKSCDHQHYVFMTDRTLAQLLFFVVFFVCGIVLLVYSCVNAGVGIDARVTNYTTTYDKSNIDCLYTTCPIFIFDYHGKSYTSCSDEADCVCNIFQNVSISGCMGAYPIGYSEEFRVKKHNPNDCTDLENELATFIISLLLIVGSFVFAYMLYLSRKKQILQDDQLELVKHRASFSSNSSV